MDCLVLLNTRHKSEILQMVGMINMASELFEIYKPETSIKHFKTIIPSEDFNLFVWELFETDNEDYPYRLRMLYTKYPYIVGMWDEQYNQWLNKHINGRNISNKDYLLQLYDDFDILGDLNEVECQNLVCKKVVTINGVLDSNHCTTKYAIGKIKRVDDRIFLIGASVSI